MSEKGMYVRMIGPAADKGTPLGLGETVRVILDDRGNGLDIVYGGTDTVTVRSTGPDAMRLAVHPLAPNSVFLKNTP